ncbi:DUF4013 domain-containing protein [Methanobrevibacter sp.]|uniref:DUF4013 domain-containing protein n=1 Tax=Methanobrevibacter sp. TaxID=66852 RepID=UPI0038665B02
MDVGQIISNSFKYPFRNIAKLPLLFLLFILMAIVPIGMALDNDYVVILGVISFFLFILIVPGYLLSIVKTGSKGSSILPSFNLVNNIYDSIRVLSLRVVYMIVPAVMFYIAFTTLGPASIDSLRHLYIHTFLATLGLMLLIIFITYVLFEFLLFFAKARMAYFNSLTEALKINKVIGDIRNIGIFNIIKWAIVMLVLMSIISFVTSFVMSIPYVGFLIYIGIVIPLIESIANYSLGLIYSNIAENYDDLDRLEGEIKRLKYEN